ncbi:ABC transporter substrate-binding protein [Texcoconibacillus texcoconensis]|uniref:Iron complex transport system substrate-binding protein n=1 Tax=Texcoconibacillus texcoconensis TaxID=1095777 RepID=A0A840QNJ0_9BACI|nr:helical backbone metal receptor [Texcoconibacillus texcoconensis]MBB5172944.1 iron complex transport system substrate-binding protein [Texcoconibacillus texcoconensis]
MLKRGKRLTLSVIFFGVLLVGCNDAEEIPKDLEDQRETESAGDEGAFPVTVKDAWEREVTIDEEPEELISILPSNTEFVYTLGAFERLVAVTDNDDYPAEVEDLPSVGDMEIDIEALLMKNPDLVLAGELNNPDGVEQIEEAGVDVIVVDDAHSIAEVQETMTMIGEVLGLNDKAEELNEDFDTRIAQIEEKADMINDEERARVWVEIWPEPELFTVGEGTILNEMIEMVGAENVVNEQGWPEYNEEDAVLHDPDIIITTYGAAIEDSKQQVLDRSAWQDVEAVKNDRVHEVDSGLVERTGPRIIEGVEQLAEKIYPDIY